MLQSKIYIGYEIKNQLPTYKPNDIISGTMRLKNNDKKEIKFKELYVELLELYRKYVRGRKGNSWDHVSNTLVKYPFSSKISLKPGDSLAFDFEFSLPKWKVKKEGKKFKEWHLALYFMQKSKLITSRGSNKMDATCVLPVIGTKVTPSFGNVLVK